MYKNSLEKKLAAGRVVKHHTTPEMGRQDMAQKAYNVCQILRYILDEKVGTHLFKAALDLDVSKLFTGEVPESTLMHDMGLANSVLLAKDALRDELKLTSDVNLSHESTLILAFAEAAEVAYTALHEFNQGNRYAHHMLLQAVLKMRSLSEGGELPPKAQEIYEDLTQGLANMTQLATGVRPKQSESPSPSSQPQSQ